MTVNIKESSYEIDTCISAEMDHQELSARLYRIYMCTLFQKYLF